jgi:glycosyltransferase involved in cell wall biosynthesis
VFCGGFEGAAREEVRDGVRYLRRGSRFNVYAWAAVYHLSGRFGPHDAVIDVQNGIPFFSPLYCGRPVAVLVHHVHREQWWMWFRPGLARLGWWMEAKLSPRLYHRARYITVSESTREELISLGVSADRISVARNGAPDVTSAPPIAKTVQPSLAYVGRLVPHKRVELLLRAAAELRPGFPDLTVRVVGRGPGEAVLRALATELRIEDMVRFDGFVDEATKARVLTESWILVLPSVKEGWGLAITEAAASGTPAVAFRVPGLSESVLDGTTGLLADSFDELVGSLRRLLTDGEARTRMGESARAYSLTLTWETTTATVASILEGMLAPSARSIPVLVPGVADA